MTEAKTNTHAEPKVIVVIFATTNLLLATIVACFVKEYTANAFQWLEHPIFMLFPAQGTFASLWIVLSGKRTALRILFSAIGIVLGIRFLTDNTGVNVMIALFVFQLTGMSLLLLVCRLLGLELKLASENHWQPAPFQFTIGQLLTWTTLLAVLLGLSHYIPPISFHAYTNPQYCVFTIIHLSVAIASIWMVFNNVWFPLRVYGLVVSLAFGIVLEGVCWVSFGESAVLLMSEAVLTIGGLAVVRWAGYQMTWHWRLRWRA